MTEFSRLIITEKGQQLISKIFSGTMGVRFTKISTSSKAYEEAELSKLEALGEIRQTNPVAGVERTEAAAVKVVTAFTNSELTEGYYLRSMGLFAEDPDEGEILYGVTAELSGNCYMPPCNGVTLSALDVEMVTAVGNAENISLEVNPTAAVTVGQLNALRNRVETLEGRVANVETQIIPVYVQSENLVPLVSGEKLSTAFGKISKAVSELISHLADNVRHITASERSKWNGKTTTTFSRALNGGTKIGTIFVDGEATDIFCEKGGTSDGTGGNADTLNGYTAEQLIQSNPNLLLNPDFKINQSGQAEYSGDGIYTVDNWRIYGSGLTVGIQSDGVILSNQNSENPPHFKQNIENPEILCNKTVTVSCKFRWQNSNSTNKLKIALQQTQIGSEWQTQDFSKDGIVSATFTLTKGVYAVSLVITGDIPASAVVEWVKLELGSVATPFVSPDSMVEALKCYPIENPSQQVLLGNGKWGDIPSNPNLLINPDFKINQSGQTVYESPSDSNSWRYSVDGVRFSRGTVTVLDEGINFKSAEGDFYKKLNCVTEYSAKAGETVTITALAKVKSVSGNVWLRVADDTAGAGASLAIKSAANDFQRFSRTITLNADVSHIAAEFLCNSTTNDSIDIDIKQWKLELGSVSTPFVPPNPDVELLKCHGGYLVKHDSDGYYLEV